MCRQRGCVRHAQVGLLAMACFILQNSVALAQDDASDPTAILRTFLDVNDIWLNPKAERLSYVVTGTIKERATFVERVWIDGPAIRWELDELGERPAAHTVIIRGDSTVYRKGPAKVVREKTPAGDVHAFAQGVTWRSAVHSISEKGIPDDARIVERKKVDGREVVIVEMTVPAHRRIGLGIRGPYLGYAGVAGRPPADQFNKVRLHIGLPDHFPILEEYPEKMVQFRFGEQPLRFDRGLAPSRITYSDKRPDGTHWELELDFQKFESQWLLQMAKNRQDGMVGSALEVSDVSTAPAGMALFEVPEH